MNKEINEIAERLKGLREACGYTVEELCSELSFDVETYKKYEETGEDVPISTVYAVANKFGVDFTEIITGRSARLDTGKPTNSEFIALIADKLRLEMNVG